jgi:hypothetical protein
MRPRIHINMQEDKNRWNNDLRSLFHYFHDFTITEVHQREDTVILKVVIPWGQMLNPPELDYTITIALKDCSDLSCTYWILKGDEDEISKPLGLRKNIEWRTTDPETISSLGLEVQSHLYSPPDHYLLRSNSDRSINDARIAGGDLSFRTRAFKLFDADNKPMELCELEAWGDAWSKGIQVGHLLSWHRP